MSRQTVAAVAVQHPESALKVLISDDFLHGGCCRQKLRIVDVIGLVEIDFAHDVLSIDLCLFIGNVLVLDECLGEFCFCDYSISLEVDPMEAADNRILVFVLNYEIDHEDQDSKLKISYFQGAEMSHLFKNVEHAFMVLG